LFDDNDRLLKRINLVDRGQDWTVTHRAEVSIPRPNNVQQQVLRTANPNQPGGAFTTSPLYPFPAGRPGQSIWSYIREHEYELYPTRYDMLNIVDNSIKDL
jgi:hypothetical protein